MLFVCDEYQSFAMIGEQNERSGDKRFLSNWETRQIGIPGLSPEAFVFGSIYGTYLPTIQTAWETLKLLANGLEPRVGDEGVKWNQEQLRRIDLRWHDLRHEGACRLLADGVDIWIIQLMLGHASIQQAQRLIREAA